MSNADSIDPYKSYVLAKKFSSHSALWPNYQVRTVDCDALLKKLPLSIIALLLNKTFGKKCTFAS